MCDLRPAPLPAVRDDAGPRASTGAALFGYTKRRARPVFPRLPV